jgi:hypothetical protein
MEKEKKDETKTKNNFKIRIKKFYFEKKINQNEFNLIIDNFEIFYKENKGIENENEEFIIFLIKNFIEVLKK